MASPAESLPADFDPEDHVAAANFDADTAIPEGVATLNEFFVTKRHKNSMTCWKCYTSATHTWCVQIDPPWGAKVTTL
jgi:hypothetical protein